MMKEKKGTLSATMIVGIILLVIGFGILLIFMYNFYWVQDIDRTVCHESAIYKATLPDILDVKEYIPLKCHTRKVCIGQKSAWVPGFLKKAKCDDEFKGEKYTNVWVSSNEDKREKQINQFLAREMAECWEMLGEGKIQLFKREFARDEESGLPTWETKRCVICTRISFDEELKKELGEIKGLGDYLIRHKVPNSDESYWEFLSSGMDSEGYTLENDKYSLVQKAVVFIEHDKTDAIKWLLGFGTGAAGGGIGAKI